MPGRNRAPRQTTRRGHPCPDRGFASVEARASLLLLHLYPVRTTPSRGGSRSRGCRECRTAVSSGYNIVRGVADPGQAHNTLRTVLRAVNTRKGAQELRHLASCQPQIGLGTLRVIISSQDTVSPGRRLP